MTERRTAPGYALPLLDSPPTRNGKIDHTGCPHDATPAGRKLCRANARQETTVEITMCPWCPDPDAPDARYHENGNADHVPPIVTADRKVVHIGDRVFDYYDGHWGTIGRIGADGWFDHDREDGQGWGFLDGSRVCVRIPPGNPFYGSHGAGNPA